MAKKSILTKQVFNQLDELGKDEILHYVREFPNEIDYNIAQFGNLLCYYEDIRDLMQLAEYKTERYTDDMIWHYYKSIVREVVNKYFIKK